MLMIYNTKTKKKEVLSPIEPGKVNLYVCGMTVYDYCHIGHARSVAIFFDIVYRFLSFYGYEVNYVRNITDIDDKIIKRANENQQSISDLTETMITAMMEDFSRLGNLEPIQQPRATQHIDGMLTMIQTLIDKGFAYQGESGDVYYDVSQFDNYGQLAHRKLEDLRAGERIAVADDKQDPLDFVLWKAAKPDEPHWQSPWGKGRPGWHLECSVMSMKCLHNQVDIHGGGMDLLFPHHQNEVAQSEAASGQSFVNIWMHVGFLQINNEKMSKSLGNLFTIREVLEKYNAEAIRYFLLATHYRSPFNYSEQGIVDAHASLERLYQALRDTNPSVAIIENSQYEKDFVTAMCDDFNVPIALSILFELARDINRHKQSNDLAQASALAAVLRRLAAILGLLQQDPDVFLKAGLSGQAGKGKAIDDQHVEQLIAQRQQARVNKDWLLADSTRQQLADYGILLEDNDGQTSWRRS